MDDIFQFEGFRLDRRGLFRRDERGVFAPIAIGSRALDVLCVLVERAGNLVPRDEIIDAIWPAIVVEDNNLSAPPAPRSRATGRQLYPDSRSARLSLHCGG